MDWEQERINESREKLVVKDNRLLQTVTRRKYELKAQEQKIIGYLLSMIQPEDVNRKPPYLYTFDIRTFCEICGISPDSGSNLQSVKKALDELAEHSFWLNYGQGEFRFQWIVTPDIQPGNGKVEVEIASKVFPYLVGLTKKFTQYELWQILPLKSTYSIALYELLKSYSYQKSVTVSLADIRRYLGIPDDKYKDFRNFQQKVLNTAKREINDLTDLNIDWKGIRDGRFYAWIEFTITPKQDLQAVEAYRRGRAILNGVKHKEGQQNLFE